MLIQHFNGAALFQVRKADVFLPLGEQLSELQWGRTLSSAERSAGSPLCDQKTPTSMGPHSFKCGKWRAFGRPLGCFATSMGPHSFKCGKQSRHLLIQSIELALQWGRTLSSAERFSTMRQVFLDNQTSMGPHSFKCGKPSSLLSQIVQSPSFNGAALFQVRKAVVGAGADGGNASPSMGPHSFKCGKLIMPLTTSSRVRPLQWGRTLSSAES